MIDFNNILALLQTHLFRLKSGVYKRIFSSILSGLRGFSPMHAVYFQQTLQILEYEYINDHLIFLHSFTKLGNFLLIDLLNYFSHFYWVFGGFFSIISKVRLFLLFLHQGYFHFMARFFNVSYSAKLVFRKESNCNIINQLLI